MYVCVCIPYHSSYSVLLKQFESETMHKREPCAREWHNRACSPLVLACARYQYGTSDSTALFADDTTIFLVGKDPVHLNSSLQSCLLIADSWMTRNGLSLNHTKTKCMLIHSPRSQTPTLDINLHGHVIEQVRKFKFLGVYSS